MHRTKQGQSWLPAPGQAVVAAVAASLPLLVLVALYLPSGLLAPVRLAVVTLSVVALLSLVRRRGWSNPVLWASVTVGCVFALFGVVGLLRYPAITTPSELAHVAVIFAACAALAVLGRSAVVTLALLAGWMVAFGVAAVVGVWESVTGRHLSVNLPARRFGQGDTDWNAISAFFDNPNLYAYQLGVVAPILMVALFWSRRWWQRAAVVAALVLVAQQLVMTGGRVALVVVLLTGVAVLVRSRRAVLALLGAAAVFAVAVALKVGPALSVWSGALQTYRDAHVAGRSTWIRVRLTQAGWHMAAESNWLGMGPGSFAALAPLPTNPYRTRHWGGHSNAHWGMTEVVAEYGLVTLVVLVSALLTAALATLWWGRSRPDAGRGSIWSGHRVGVRVLAASWLLVPLISLSHSTWLRQPMTAVHLATLTAATAMVWQRHRRNRQEADFQSE